MIENTTLKTRILIGFSLPLLAIVLLVLTIYFTLGSVQKDSAEAEKKLGNDYHLALTAKGMQLDVTQVQQWLTDISATRGLDGLNDGFDEAENSAKSFQEGLGKFRSHYQESNNVTGTAELQKISSQFNAYYEAGKKMATAYVSGGPAEGNKMMANFDESSAALAEVFDGFIETQTVSVDNSLGALESLMNKLGTLVATVLISGLVVILLSAGWALWIERSISKQMDRIAEWLGGSSDEISQASAQLNEAGQEVADGASQQAAGIEEISSSLEEMTSMTRRNTDNAREASTHVQENKHRSEKANESMLKMNTAMEEISRASDETSKIIKTIDEIAFQTNLLALNAAVEAARAGEAGAGFAVVADEVRNLAMRAAEAAKDTSDLIETTVTKVKDGTEFLNMTNEEFSIVAERAGKVSTLVDDITSASEDQLQGIEQINKAVTDMDRVTQSNAAQAEETASAAQELDSQSSNLQGMVNELNVLVGRHANGSGATKSAAYSSAGSSSSPAPSTLSLASKPAPSIGRTPDANMGFDENDDDFEDF